MARSNSPAQLQQPWIIAIAGGSGSGKTTFATRLQTRLGVLASTILYQDSYYIDQSARFKEDGGDVNFDHPDALDFPLMAQHLETLCRGIAIEVPVYDFKTHKRLSLTAALAPKSVIVVDGTLILSQEGLRPFFHESVFLDIDEETRFSRRFRRDVKERGRQPDGVKRQFFNQVKPMHDLFVQPSAAHATHRIAETTQIDALLEALVARLSSG